MPAPVINDSVVGGIGKFLEALNSSGGTPIEQLSPKDARPVLVGAQNSVPADLSGIEGSEKTIDHDGKPLKLHIGRPAGAAGDLPVFKFFHGGGSVLGDYPKHERLVHDLVVEAGAMAVFPDYTPSLEAHYPTAIEQAYAATNWVSARSSPTGRGSPSSATASAGTGRPWSA
jgi:acetyl esterase/lipase